ncbi:lantibiotic dehydratase [Pedobacter jejuensis]|uniref:Lantibiotic dehydratase N-terminal domain-containing protein n=1 Tax=Pedobacter jejuensis TaxID=1268550 RepID=A0A3N0BSF4_9SPHI|nr:lantibiotic dehydratase [Pedobacter jejuensis]RNL51766.1 hypothetical protein D7004_13900 [Pedobacter jejuensis]
MRNPVNREIKIFPHVFIRYASGHHEALEQLCWAEMEGLYDNYNELVSELDLLKEVICEYLYEAIQIAVNIDEKKELLNLKRDIFNLRNISDRNWQKFLESLLPEKKLNFGRFMELKTDRTYLNGVWENAYQKKITFHRTLLQIISSRELLQKGIRLSSSILSEQLKSFISTPSTAFKTRELRQEFSLLRYITRMHFKTSPFSTFTCLGLGDVSTISSVVHIPVLSDDLVISKVRLNNEIFNYLKTLITLSPDINELLCIRLNPTIQVEGDNIRLLVNFHNLESFQTLKSSEILKTILDKEFNGKFLTLKCIYQ